MLTPWRNRHRRSYRLGREHAVETGFSRMARPGRAGRRAGAPARGRRACRAAVRDGAANRQICVGSGPCGRGGPRSQRPAARDAPRRCAARRRARRPRRSWHGRTRLLEGETAESSVEELGRLLAPPQALLSVLRAPLRDGAQHSPRRRDARPACARGLARQRAREAQCGPWRTRCAPAGPLQGLDTPRRRGSPPREQTAMQL
jgi:hypothetical protein